MNDVFFFQSQNQVHVIGEPLIPVRHHGQAAHDEIFHSGGIQRLDNGFHAADFHGRIMPAAASASRLAK